eukprot:scaffold6301_cov165-Amphora_coffeaeformis.AAC.12
MGSGRLYCRPKKQRAIASILGIDPTLRDTHTESSPVSESNVIKHTQTTYWGFYRFGVISAWFDTGNFIRLLLWLNFSTSQGETRLRCKDAAQTAYGAVFESSHNLVDQKRAYQN